jgi:hypothetical protein
MSTSACVLIAALLVSAQQKPADGDIPARPGYVVELKRP